jgi:DNA modification methylase
VAQVAASMQQFGWTNPILVGGDNVILAGHARLLAARKLNLALVPVIVLDHLDENDRRAMILADNKIAENAGWDTEMLRVELTALRDDGYNLDIVGFSKEELDVALADPEQDNAGLTEDDAAPAPQDTAITVPGDVWVMGAHRLLCGDATVLADVEKLLAGGLADMAFLDPPYNVDYEGKTARKLKIGNDALGGKFYQFLHDACSNVLATTKGAIYICMSSSELHTLHQAFTDAGGHWSTFVIWAKHHFTMGRSDYQRQYEPILYGWREGTNHFWCGARDQGDIWFIKRPAASPDHPTTKPVELVERAIRNSSKTRDTILDTFAGSGTTLIACEKSARQARVLEIDPRYCDVIVRRFMDFSERPAILEATGETFAVVSASRSEAFDGAARPRTAA